MFQLHAEVTSNICNRDPDWPLFVISIYLTCEVFKLAVQRFRGKHEQIIVDIVQLVVICCHISKLHLKRGSGPLRYIPFVLIMRFRADKKCKPIWSPFLFSKATILGTIDVPEQASFESHSANSFSWVLALFDGSLFPMSGVSSTFWFQFATRSCSFLPGLIQNLWIIKYYSYCMSHTVVGDFNVVLK